MKRLRFYLKIYPRIVAQDIKSKMSYRSDFVISMIGMIATDIIEVAAFYILFQNFPSVCGWNYYEMLFLYGFSLIALTPLQCLFDNNWSLRMYVYEGEFVKYCFRPMNIYFYFISEVFDVKGLGQLLVGLGCMIYSWKKLAIPVTLFMLAKLLLALFSASLFMVAIMNFAAATCFWVIKSGFIMVTVNKLRDYAKYPVTIYSPMIRLLFTFLIPIGFIAYYPSLSVVRPLEAGILTWLSPVYGIFFFYLSYRFWMRGANQYSGTGS